MIEVELKFSVLNEPQLRERLSALGASLESEQEHVDTYFNHPCRDFAQTSEALRIRKVDGVPHVTYKGAKLPGNVKARRELEWAIGSSASGSHPADSLGDPDGSKLHELLTLLGFREVASVKKRRENYDVDDDVGRLAVTIDRVDEVGTYVEVEAIAKDETEVESSRTRVITLAKALGLTNSEPRSYLGLLLACRSG